MVSSNGKFRSFLVRIRIPKYNTENKVLRKEFYKKNKKEGDKKDKVFQSFL